MHHLMTLPLALLCAVRVTLVLRRECPGLWRRTEEHLRELNPVAAITACEECLCQNTGKCGDDWKPFSQTEKILFNTHLARLAHGTPVGDR